VHSLLPVFKLTTVDLQCRTQVGLWQALSVTAGFLLINIFLLLVSCNISSWPSDSFPVLLLLCGIGWAYSSGSQHGISIIRRPEILTETLILH